MKLPEVGTVFESRYRLDDVLGTGGFATVYLATDVAADRRVALKVLRPGITGYDGTVRSRFEREVQILANLRDPHTITMFDFGTSVDGYLFMVTEYVPGVDLSELLAQRGRLEPHEVTHILRQVLSALREAHTNGLLHRDIKPANIRISSYMGDPLHAKLLDFGIAKEAEGAQQITAAGELVGTLRYMSPEQLLTTPLSPASDIYSLGVVGFEMLLGPKGIHGKELHHQMDRLNTGYVFSVPELERIGPQLAQTLDRMTARDASARLRSADDVLASLAGPAPKPATQGYPATHGPPPPTAPAWQPARPHTQTETVDRAPTPRNFLWAMLGGVLILIVLSVLALIKATSPTPGDPSEPTEQLGRRDLAFIKSDPAQSAPSAPKPAVIPEEPEEPEEPKEPEIKFPDYYSRGCGKPAELVGRGSLEFDVGLSRGFLEAYIFPDYLPNRAWPLIVMLHENFETPNQFMTYSRLPQLADEKEFLLVAPTGNSPYAWATPEEFELVRSSIEGAMASMCVDKRRVYIVGHAAGGEIAERAPCEMPEVAAIASSSHRGETSKDVTTCRPDKPIPYLHLAPLHDKFNPVQGGVGCSRVEKLSLKQKEAIWRKSNQCSGARKVWKKHEGSTCYTWDCEAEFAVCHIDGGRGWPGTTPRLIDFNKCDGTPARFPYAETIWEFFERHAPK